MRSQFFASILLTLPALISAGESYPQATLTTKDLSLVVMLPDAKVGYYRSTRFDWSGMVSQATWQGHTFFCELKQPHNPSIHDHGAGTAEEFDLDGNASFAEAKPGEPFIKIGVGILIKGTKPEYHFNEAYQVQQFAPWTVSKKNDAITFAQDLPAVRGLGYHYEKNLLLDAAGSGFRIEHRLKNTGTRELSTEHYGHNMILIDQQQVGPAYTVAYTLPLGGAPVAGPESARFDGVFVRFTKDRIGTVWSQLPALAGQAGANRAEIALEQGPHLNVSGDLAPTKAVIYAEIGGVCPEFFVSIALKPGEEKTWTCSYSFAAAANAAKTATP